MKPTLSFLTTLAAILLPAGAFADQTINYPTSKAPQFSLTAPDDWKFEPAEDAEDYCTLENESAAVIYFRSVEGTKETFDQVVKDNIDYLEETYADVEIANQKEHEHKGLSVVTSNGSGKDKETKTEYLFSLSWIVLPTGKVAEVWYICPKGDADSTKVAGKIMQSFTAGK